MDVLEAIRTRRSFALVKDEAVPESVITQVLEAGTWAPSHFRTEPWSFFVMTGDGRDRLADVFGKIALKNGEDDRVKLERERKKPFRAPVVIAVAAEPSTNPRAIQMEEYGAVYACIQNMLLAAHGLGLAGYWRTGAPAYDPLINEFFGLSEAGKVLGFLYFGYPKRPLPQGKRDPIAAKTTWMT